MQQPSPPHRQHSSTQEAERDEVFTRWVERYARFLYGVAHSVLRHPQDAEDAVGDALLKLYRGERWREVEEERAFLARVVWRTALDQVMARKPQAKDEIAELRLPDRRSSPEAMAAEADERALLWELIERLPAELREPLQLSVADEMNSRLIGEVMGLPEGTVRTRLMRARAELRRTWQQRAERSGREHSGTRPGKRGVAVS